MKIFRHKNGFLYSIEQIGMGKCITPPRNWQSFMAVPFYTNKSAPEIPNLGKEPDLSDFELEFET